MKILVNTIGILLIVFGSSVFYFNGFSYATNKEVLQVGSLKITEEDQKVLLPKWVGGAAIGAGILLIALSIVRNRE